MKYDNTIIFDFRRYPEQKSFPIPLKKGVHYYIEGLHKEQYGNDTFAPAVLTPDKKFYAPIPSQFLWTAKTPHPHGMLIIYF